MIIIKEAFLRACRDFSVICCRIISNPFQIEKSMGPLKTIITCTLVGFLLFGIGLFPYLTDKLISSNRELLYLNIMEPPLTGNSYLCTFNIKSHNNLILNTSLSDDHREVTFSMPEADISEKRCKLYTSTLPFDDPNVKATIVNVYTAEDHHFEIKSKSKHEKSFVIKSTIPLRVFVRNKDAMLVELGNSTESLVKTSNLRLDYRLHKIQAKGHTFLDFDGKFKSHSYYKLRDVWTNVRVILYQTPTMSMIDFTPLSEIEEEPILQVNFGFQEVQNHKTFVKMSAKLVETAPELYQFRGHSVSKIEYINSEQTTTTSSYGQFLYYLLLIFGSLFTGLLSFNLYYLINERRTKGKKEPQEMNEKIKLN